MKASDHHRYYKSQPKALSSGGQRVREFELEVDRYQFHNVTECPISKICGRDGCGNIVTQRSTGRPALYCSAACRVAAHRQNKRGPIRAEVRFGSATTRSRREDHSWMVKLFRDKEELIVAFGQTKDAAERLTARLNEFLS